jgi:hypothetical protein
MGVGGQRRWIPIIFHPAPEGPRKSAFTVPWRSTGCRPEACGDPWRRALPFVGAWVYKPQHRGGDTTMLSSHPLLPLCAALAVASVAVPVAHADVVYNYTGAAFDQASPPNASQLGNHMSIALTFANPLPANAVNLSVCPNGCTVAPLDFLAHGGGPVFSSMANGGQLLSNGVVSTDAAGQITDWTLTFLFLSIALVSSSSATAYPDLLLPVFDAGEANNTHWGASALGAWAQQAVPAPGTLALVLAGLVLMLRLNRRH